MNLDLGPMMDDFGCSEVRRVWRLDSYYEELNLNLMQVLVFGCSDLLLGVGGSVWSSGLNDFGCLVKDGVLG